MWPIYILVASLIVLVKSNEEAPLLQLLIPKNLAENQTVRLNCALIQGKDVTLEWYFNNEKIKDTNRKKVKLGDDSIDLIIKSLQVDDLGNYRCIASNRLSKDEKIIDLFFPGKIVCGDFSVEIY